MLAWFLKWLNKYVGQYPTVALTQIPVTNVHALGPIDTEFHYGILELLKQKKKNEC